MKYLLVIQFAVSDSDDFDSLIELEDKITNEIEPAHEVDGHDFGMGEFNIFIFTDDPVEASLQARKNIPQNDTNRMKIAYRSVNGEAYKTIYPDEFSGKFEIK